MRIARIWTIPLNPNSHRTIDLGATPTCRAAMVACLRRWLPEKRAAEDSDVASWSWDAETALYKCIPRVGTRKTDRYVVLAPWFEKIEAGADLRFKVAALMHYPATGPKPIARFRDVKGESSSSMAIGRTGREAVIMLQAPVVPW